MLSPHAGSDQLMEIICRPSHLFASSDLHTTLDPHWSRRCTTHVDQLLPVRDHPFVRFEHFHYSGEYLFALRICRFGDAVVDPLSVAPPGHEGSSSQIRQMSRYFWIVRSKRLGEKADTYFPVAQKVQEPQPCIVRQGGKKQLCIEAVFHTHKKIVSQNNYGLT